MQLPPLDPDEPGHIAAAVAEMGLRFIVITSVTRDDLSDGGAEHFSKTIQAIKETIPGAGIEVLTPDFGGNREALDTVLAAGPTVFNHNVETVRQIAPILRPEADYDHSLQVLASARANSLDIVTKSGFMVGVGETDTQIKALLADLADVGCDIVTIGQYLQPTRHHHPVDRYVRPEHFDEYARWGQAAGIAQVSAGPFVRSSYRAAALAEAARNAK